MRWFVSALVVLTACVRSGPQAQPETATPAPEPVRVPEGCLDALDGPWVHADDARWRYEADDDGGTLVLRVTRVPGPDAGFVPRKFRRAPEPELLEPGAAAQAFLSLDGGKPAAAEDAGVEDAGTFYPDVRVELARTPGGFVGFTLAPLAHPAGRTCDGRFATRVISCLDGGLVIESQPATALGEACQSPPRPREATPLRHRLVRPDAG